MNDTVNGGVVFCWGQKALRSKAAGETGMIGQGRGFAQGKY